MPTLEDLAAQLAAQDVALAEVARLAKAIPDTVAISEAALADFDDATRPRDLGRLPMAFGVRA